MTDLGQVAPALAAAQEVEVSSVPKRRRFSAEYKRKILREADACSKLGELGALLRREGIYSSSLASWRKARERGELGALAPKKRGPVARQPNPLEQENAELRRALAKKDAELKRAEIAIGLQKKVAELFGIQLPKTDEEP
jgi:transposase-like protein